MNRTTSFPCAHWRLPAAMGLCLAAVTLAAGLLAAERNGERKNVEKIITEKTTFAAGCFWGVEETFRQVTGVVNTTVGYTGGHTENPTYKDVCSGRTGHAEAVLVEYDPTRVSFEQLLKIFWECHDPTQQNRQGPDIGEQYRSAVFFHTPAQEKAALAARDALQAGLKDGRTVATQIAPAGPFWRAEDYHQRYFEKRGGGSCRSR